MSKIEVLVTSMHQKDTSKYEKMNLQGDAVIANQADDCFYVEEQKGEHTVKMITTNTRGTSINRNLAIMYSNAEYVIFSDDDQVFVDGYEQIIEDEFKKCPKADAIKFYCESTNKKRPLSFKQPSRLKRVGKKEIMSAGVHLLAIKRQFLLDSHLSFQINMGPGKEIYCGEDSAFLSDFIESKGKIYVSPKLLGYVEQTDSSWFEGITERYLNAMGYVYARIYGKLAILAIYRRAYKLRKKVNNFNLLQMIKLMKKGMKQQRVKGQKC